MNSLTTPHQEIAVHLGAPKEPTATLTGAVTGKRAPSPDSPMPFTVPRHETRLRWARRCGAIASWASRTAGSGDGAVLGGMVARRIVPDIASTLAEPMEVVVISGTNGKTTTSRMISDAVASSGPVAANRTGANLVNGVVGALLRDPHAERAVLEVDEAVVEWAMDALRPAVLVLLNLSRDQLDRMHEVQATATAWRRAILAHPPRAIVANADDPLVVWAAGDQGVSWVHAGLVWTADATTCMWCGATIRFLPTGWRCDACGRGRPAESHPEIELGRDLGLPGRSARANALMALATIDRLGLPMAQAVEAVRRIRSVEGRYEVFPYRQVELRLHLAKNPAGWCDTLDLISTDLDPVIVVLNSRVQDGRDPSWIWDVDLEQLRGRTVISLGERSSDLSVRLAYADVDATEVSSLEEAADVVGSGPAHVIANYSAFQQIRKLVARGG